MRSVPGIEFQLRQNPGWGYSAVKCYPLRWQMGGSEDSKLEMSIWDWMHECQIIASLRSRLDFRDGASSMEGGSSRKINHRRLFEIQL